MRRSLRAQPPADPQPAARRPGPDVDSGAAVPFAIRTAAAWAWRIGLIMVVGGALFWLLSKIGLLVVPLLVAALLTALLQPVTNGLRRSGWPNWLATTVTLVGLIGMVIGALGLVGRQLVIGFRGLWNDALAGVEQLQIWLAEGPLHLSSDQVDRYVDEAQRVVQENQSAIVSSALSFGSSAGNFAAGLLLTLFALVFFLAEGEAIWKFLVRLLPRQARIPVDGAGRRSWITLGNYVRIQILVALIDAIGIGAGAAIIGVPLALPLGVLVLFGSFIPIVGALFTGFVAVLLALVANGWVNALIMLGIVLLVQQAESQLLQPLIMGRAVNLHPLAVVLVVAGGTMVAGVPGALFSVPLLAVVNAFTRYIASRQWEPEPEDTEDHNEDTIVRENES